MVCVIMRDVTGVSKTVTDKDLLVLLDELRKLSGDTWELEEREVTRKRLFRKATTEKVYSLYAMAGPEWQCINFVGNTEYSINMSVSKGQMGSLMVGYRMGHYDAKRKAAA